MSTLFVVATPIGNLGDISPRGLECLQAVDLIACEDTRHTAKLLHHFGIKKSMESYHDFNEEAKARQLVSRIREGLKVALVSDAGTPGVSDPGYRLVRACRESGVPVVAIPGANAAVTALSASGLPPDEFLFVGFLPVKLNARREKLESLRGVTATLIFYEAPHRIQEMLRDVLEVLGDREACIGRELTKLHEEYLFGKLAEVIPKVNPLGEFVIVVAGGTGAGADEPREVTLEGLSRKEILKLLAEKTGIPKKVLYDALLKD
jgi:16S rRNA (cytidine1402-2'-O)-methyltransferase